MCNDVGLIGNFYDTLDCPDCVKRSAAAELKYCIAKVDIKSVANPKREYCKAGDPLRVIINADVLILETRRGLRFPAAPDKVEFSELAEKLFNKPFNQKKNAKN